MSLPELASVDQGTIAAVIRLPHPWPPAKPLILEQDLSNGRLRIEVGLEMRIRATVLMTTANGDQTYLEALSCRVVPAQPTQPILLFVSWSASGFINITVNGHVVASTDPQNAQRRCLKIDNNGQTSAAPLDFSERNRKAISRRRGNFLGIRPKPDTLSGGTGYLCEALHAEAAHLKSLLTLISQGETYHARGVAARLRLLILRGGQYPLLQTVAGAKNCPLIVYTAFDPTAPIPMTPSYAMVLACISPAPTELLSNPIDLDVWLSLRAIQIGATTFSHEKVIADLGNTLGSHLDPNILPSIIALRTVYIKVAELKTDLVVKYLVEVASSVLALCDFVLAQPIPV